MSYLIASDLHLTDAPRDEYRWGLFDFLLEHITERNVSDVLLLGDLTDKKSHAFSTTLVNRVALQVSRLANPCRVHIVMGNHDYLEPGRPFLGFLRHIDRVRFYTKPAHWPYVRRRDWLFIPHTKVWPPEGLPERWDGTTFMHQTFKGAHVENGTRMKDGLSASIMRDYGQVYSGDIHVPQTIGPVRYVGAPYPIRFGDSFDGAVLLVQGKKVTRLRYKTLRKLTLRADDADDVRHMGADKGDQLRVILRVNEREWATQRDRVRHICDELELDLCSCELRVMGSTPSVVRQRGKPFMADPLGEFCLRNDVDLDLEQAGRDLLWKSE